MQNLFSNLFILLLIFVSLLSPAFAQEAESTDPLTDTEEDKLFEEDRPAEITDVQALRAEFKQYTQDPSSKIAKFEMILKSNIDSDRIRVTWTIKGVSNAVNEAQLNLTLGVKKGGVYTLPVEVVPITTGVTEIYGKAQAFGADANVVATVRKNFASNSNGEILPLTEDFNSKKNMNLIINILKIVFVVLLLSMIGLFALKKAKVWYKKD